MLAVLAIVLPVFLIVGAGFVAAKTRAFPDQGVDALMTFVIQFATPALLFSSMYDLDIAAVFEPRMLIAFYTGAFTCFAVGVMLARVFGRRPGEAVAIGFAGFFANTLLVGLPIATRAYGEDGAQPIFGIIALHAPALYIVGMVAMEISRQDGQGAWAGARRAARSIAKNPLMLGLAAGLALNLTEIRLPTPVVDAAALLASATLPAALFALGAAITRYSLRDDLGWAITVSAISLVLHPALTWILAVPVFQLEPEFARIAVITAAMPAGLNVYVFAAMYRRAESVAAGVVLLSTALSIVTISFWLAVVGAGGPGL